MPDTRVVAFGLRGAKAKATCAASSSSCRHVVLDDDVSEPLPIDGLAAVLSRSAEREREAVVREPANLLIRRPRDRPAVDVGRLGPSALWLAVVENSDGHGGLTR